MSDGQFELFHLKNKSTNKLINDLLNMADSVLNVEIGGVTYKASDLLDPNIANKKIEEHMNQLIEMSEFLPVESTGFNYGEIQPGIFTDVIGTGPLQYHAKIANSTNQPYIFYPLDWGGQVGSPGVSSGFFAAADSAMSQRVTARRTQSAGVCRTRSGKIEEVDVNLANYNEFHSLAAAKKAFEKEAKRLGANSNCTEVHTLIAIYEDGSVRLADPVVSHQFTVDNRDGTRSDANKVNYKNINTDELKYLEFVHTHYGSDQMSRIASPQDRESAQDENRVEWLRGSGVKVVHSIYHAKSKEWIKYSERNH